MLPIPNKPGDPGIVTADDVKGIMQMQGLREIAPGDCVALHTGQGNSWSNDRYKTMKPEERQAARDLFNQGEPGFGISACEYMASRDIALTMCDTSACDAQPSGEQGPDFSVRDADPAWHLESRERRHQVSGRREGDGRRVHLGAAPNHRRDGLARQSDGALLGGSAQALRNRCTPSASTARTARPSSSR